jgi:hypothetical protein
MSYSTLKHTTLAVVLLSISLTCAQIAVSAQYFGERDSEVVRQTGCNSSAYAPVPAQDNLFVGRQFFKADGTPVGREDGCGGSAAREAIGATRWGLVLDRLDWGTKSFSIVKPLLVTPAQITTGPIQGATIRAAYDADVAFYRGQYLVAFECGFAVKVNGIEGVSSCLGVLNLEKEELPLSTLHVVVGGKYSEGGRVYHSAVVPKLLVVNDRLYIYWSEITNIQGRFVRVGVRGTELEADSNGVFWVKGANGKIAYTTDPVTIEVWGPDPKNAKSDTAVDIKSIWVSKSGIVALAGLGGSGCAKPGPEPGCFRMAMAKADRPLGDHIFNGSPLLDEALLPTNPEGYTRPIKNPAGGYSFIGLFYRPTNNGFSEQRPAPKDWSDRGAGQDIIFSFPDQSLWPIN